MIALRSSQSWKQLQTDYQRTSMLSQVQLEKHVGLPLQRQLGLRHTSYQQSGVRLGSFSLQTYAGLCQDQQVPLEDVDQLRMTMQYMAQVKPPLQSRSKQGRGLQCRI
mmetsp:Transcript_43389/g.78988  ORF Transcript_43389/g.78988 Transcript_43389/m.78988 type:complete len:108 (+) Transcript_43389:593-916(+)